MSNCRVVSTVICLGLIACGDGEARRTEDANRSETERAEAFLNSPEMQATVKRLTAKAKYTMAENVCVRWVVVGQLQSRKHGSPPSSIEEMCGALEDECAPSTIDPWGNPYEYRVKGKMVRVSSLGPDGVRGTADDISRP